MTALVPQTSNLETLVRNHTISLVDALDQLVAAKRASREAANPKAPTSKIAISDVQRTLLRRLATVLAIVELPSTARQLTDAEKAQFVPLFDEVKDAKTAVAAAEAALAEAFRNHLDAEALAAAKPDNPVAYDKHGHVLAEGEVVHPGYPKKVRRELRGGKAAPITLAQLQQLEADGKITHKQYLAMTEAVPATRRVDEVKIMDVLAAEPGLLQVLAEVAEPTDREAALWLRKNS